MDLPKSYILYFLVVNLCFCSCTSTYDDDEHEVLDLQELLMNVSNALKNAHARCSDLKDISSQLEKIRSLSGTNKAVVRSQDCSEILQSGNRASGIYNIMPLGYNNSLAVYCDMKAQGGGWTVIQRRQDYGNPVDYFYRTWDEYKKGFGHLNNEFWLGNDHLHSLTKQGKYELLVELTTMDAESAYARYSTFRVENEIMQYKLHVGGYSGNAGDALTGMHNGMVFFTKDRLDANNCVNNYKGGWWYNKCHQANLNGLNLQGPHKTFADGIEWLQFKTYYYSLFSEMKIRPLDFVKTN